MSLALNLDRRPAMERGEPKTDFRPPRIEPKEEPFEEVPARISAGSSAITVNLTKLEAELSRNRLDDIAETVRKLTYGEMMELGEALWKVKGESDVTQDALPGILHRWATGRGKE